MEIMKDNVIYNKHDNMVMVKTDGDLIISSVIKKNNKIMLSKE